MVSVWYLSCYRSGTHSGFLLGETIMLNKLTKEKYEIYLRIPR